MKGKPPDLGGPYLIGRCVYRPLGKSVYKPSPWVLDAPNAYVPTIMSVASLKTGLAKSNRVTPLVPEKLAQEATDILKMELRSIWVGTPESNLMSFDDVIPLVKRDKSPGYPYFYKYTDKGQALDQDQDYIRDRVDRTLEGEELDFIFSLTEKSELRPVEKVKLGKTRVFMASPIDHLMLCLMLFQRQNDRLVETIGSHPITLGIQIPGNQFVNTLLKLRDNCFDGDVDGCDLCFHPRAAKAIRDIRAQFLPQRVWRAVCHVYNTVYAGAAAGCGGVYRVYGNKSGWVNTSTDNSLMVWWYLIVACLKFYPGVPWSSVINALINGDDVLLRYEGDFKSLCDYLSSIGCMIEAVVWQPRHVTECVFLSHHLKMRYVEDFGDFMLAAGNLPKLLSSVNWVKKTQSLTFEESCVAHLIGLRICLFPWKEHFEEVDMILSVYLSKIVSTEFIKACLSARFNELELAYLNTRVESLDLFFSRLNLCSHVPKQVLKCVRRSLFKSDHD